MKGLQSPSFRRNQYPSEEETTFSRHAMENNNDNQYRHHQYALVEYGGGGGGYTSTKPTALLNSIFLNTVNTAAKALASVASDARNQQSEKWKPADHMRFMLMMVTWLTVWILRVLIDHFPFTVGSNPSLLLDGISIGGTLDFLSSSLLSSTSSPSSSSSSLSALSSSLASPSSVDLSILSERSESLSAKALGRALTNILVLLSEIPASSRKYQFAVTMADRIVDENARSGHVELLQINRMALSSAFARTSGLLCRSLQTRQKYNDESGSWITRTLKSLPLGSYVCYFMKGAEILFPTLGSGSKQRQIAMAVEARADDLAAEKHAEELLWITKKMIVCGAVDEALVQWSFASGLASSSLTANPRVQGLIVKITAILFGEMKHIKLEVPRQVKYGMLALWLPVFCYAENGVSRPLMTSYEKAEMERTMDEIISTLPTVDQEVILMNWFQDFTISSSDWPNLQVSYDNWCQSTRKLIVF